MAKNPPDQTDVIDPGRQARFDAQLVLGQIHGVLDVVVADIGSEEWLAYEPDNEITAEDVRLSYVEICRQFGVVQAALNTGHCDSALVELGFGGAQANVEKKGLLAAIRRLAGKTADRLAAIKNALKWSGTLTGSITVALQDAIEHIPGAATALEGIREFIETLHNLAESKGAQPTPRQGKAGRD